MQVPDTAQLNIVPFSYLDEWLYFPNIDIEYRYILGTRGSKPLIVIGLNPSTATPQRPDPTIKRIMAIAEHNGFDSIIMLNLYAQRATKPEDLDRVCNPVLHAENLKAVKWALEYAGRFYANERIPVWCAWGNLIKSRSYLSDCKKDIQAVLASVSAELLCISVTKEGQPIHPLYQKNDSKLICWNDE